jgi:preprotein translocase subunit YajC
MRALPHAILLAASSTKKSSGSSASLLIFLVAALAIAYFLIIRPRQNRMRQQQSQARSLEVGDEVVSIGGIAGRVVELDEENVRVEVAPGVVLTFLRRAVNPKAAAGSGPGAQPGLRRGWGARPAAAGPPDTSSESFGDHSADEPDDPGTSAGGTGGSGGRG